MSRAFPSPPVSLPPTTREGDAAARDCTVDLYRGEAAIELLRDADLDSAWRMLSGATAVSSRFQHPDFVRPWYEAYEGRVEPLVVLGHDPEGELGGVMALAIDRDGGVVHAGANSAWYHGYVATPDLERAFLRRSVARIFAELPIRRWRWRYLPPGAAYEWLDDVAESLEVRTRRFSTPLWSLEDAELIDRRLHKGRIRSYQNRYRRRGNLVFEVATDPALITAALDRLAAWANLRHGALHGDQPYRDDPAKLDFHRRTLAASDDAILHVLRLDDRLIAVHAGDLDGDRFFMGMQGHDPEESRQSPGTILLFLMAQQLAQRGVRLIDFTPGGEPWKERYATDFEESIQLDILRRDVRSRVEDATAATVRTIKTGLTAAGVDPGSARGWMDRARSLPRRTIDRAHELRRKPRTLVHLRGDPADASRDPHPAISPGADPVGDLLVYDNNHDRDTSRGFLSRALTCLGQGWLPLTVRAEGRLALLGWLAPDSARAAIPPLDSSESPRLLWGDTKPAENETTPPDDTALLWYVHGARDAVGRPLADPTSLLRAARERRPDLEALWILVEPDAPLGDSLPGAVADADLPVPNQH